jgi:hypothetical protein
LSTDAQGVRLVVHFSVPVFVEPVSIVPAKIDWSLDVSKGGDSTLVAVNHGGQRAQLENLTWSVDGGAASGIPSNGSAYVLSGAERHWQTNGISKRIKKSDSAVNLKVTINGLASNVLVPVVRTPYRWGFDGPVLTLVCLFFRNDTGVFACRRASLGDGGDGQRPGCQPGRGFRAT